VQELLEVPYAKGGMMVPRYSPKIEFRYTASGRNYIAEAPSVYTTDNYDRAAANLTRMYAPGTHHPIRYNPRDPLDIRFGIIEFGPLAFSFLLLVLGVALSAVGVNALVMGYVQRIRHAFAVERGIPATVVPFADEARQEPRGAMLLCPACGRPVEMTEDNCPNCLKALRAA
jgi:hypothetical protein